MILSRIFSSSRDRLLSLFYNSQVKGLFKSQGYSVAVLRIHLILMWMRIRNLDPNPGYFFKIYCIFYHDRIIKFFVLFFSLDFMQNFIKHSEIRKFYVFSLFSIVQIRGLRVNNFFCSFWLIFCPLDPDPWIRILLRIRIQKAKI